jgi:ABC-type multidrug transport system fused ATPase/permease subunit
VERPRAPAPGPTAAAARPTRPRARPASAPQPPAPAHEPDTVRTAAAAPSPAARDDGRSPLPLVLIAFAAGAAVLTGAVAWRRRRRRTPTDTSAWRAWWRLRPFVAPHRRAILLSLLLLAGTAGIELLKPWPLKLVLDDVVGHGDLEGRELSILSVAVALVVAVALLGGLFDYLLVMLLNRTGRTIVLDLRSAAFDHVQQLSLGFHTRRSTGDVLTRVTGDVKVVRDVLTESIAEVLSSVLLLVGMAAVLFWLDWQLALVAVGAAPFLVLLLLRYTPRIHEHSREERRREGALASVAHEALGTIRLARVFNREEHARERFAEEGVASLESGVAASLAAERFSWVVEAAAAIATGGVLWLGVHRVASGAISVGTLVVFVAYTRSFFKPLKSTVKQAVKVTRGAARVERVLELLDVDDTVADLPGARPAPRFQGRIEFEDVAFEYEPGRPALSEIDLVLEAGQVTAIVGGTGAGKTTLTSLIARFYDPTGGRVTIDGEDIRAYTLRSLRAQIAVVLQESVLLRASVAENIAYGRPGADRASIVAAARAANAYDFVSALPDGFDTEIGERGETLSGGQRQRIAIARAILRDAPILILDEPLAGLDAESAAAVLEALERLVRGRTVVLVTHQLATAARADKAVVLAGGRMVQQGDPAELVQVEGSYRRLARALEI